MTILEKLQQPPKPEHIKLVNGDGEHIPIGIIENELDAIFTYWGTGNYVFSKMLMPDGRLAIDASIELRVSITNEIYLDRTGSCSFFATGNEQGIEANYSAIAKSACICNAAKSLGLYFGRGLNRRLDEGVPSLPVPEKETPAFTDEDLKNTYTLKNK